MPTPIQGVKIGGLTGGGSRKTPDLLDANEARYQLRHRPVNNIYAITAEELLASL